MHKKNQSRKIQVNTSKPDPHLAGESSSILEIADKTWVSGYNCVYHGTNGRDKYRVAIKSRDDWKSYGHFNDLGTAAYVANVAILAEDTVYDFELNKISGKDFDELCEWRKHPENQKLESIARAKYNDIMKEREDIQKWTEELEFKDLNSLSSKDLLILIEKRRSLGQKWGIARKLYDSRKTGS